MTARMFDRHEDGVYQSSVEESCWLEEPRECFRSSWYLMLLTTSVSLCKRTFMALFRENGSCIPFPLVAADSSTGEVAWAIVLEKRI